MGIALQDTLLRYAGDLASAARLFTLPQLARHPALSGFAHSKKRASKLLMPYSHYFDKTPGRIGEPHIWRLSNAGQKALGLSVRNVSATSQKVGHYLAIGDTWTALAHAGLRPTTWILEPKESADFDVFMVIERRFPFLIEVQRTRRSPKQWQEKWEKRMAWLDNPKELAKAHWQPKGVVARPAVLVVDMTGGEANHPAGVLCVTPDNIASRIRRRLTT